MYFDYFVGLGTAAALFFGLWDAEEGELYITFAEVLRHHVQSLEVGFVVPVCRIDLVSDHLEAVISHLFDLGLVEVVLLEVPAFGTPIEVLRPRDVLAAELGSEDITISHYYFDCEAGNEMYI